MFSTSPFAISSSVSRAQVDSSSSLSAGCVKCSPVPTNRFASFSWLASRHSSLPSLIHLMVIDDPSIFVTV